jgi:nicotinate-nucleotide pyrophosphorylase (carboxylating)
VSTPPHHEPGPQRSGAAGDAAAVERRLPRRSGPPEPLSRPVIDRFVRPALEEDQGPGDLTSTHAVPVGARARARLVAKQPGVLAGIDVVARVFDLCDPDSRLTAFKRDGERFAPGDVVLEVEGNARGLLLAERTALNFVQRMCGTATATARLVEACAGRVRVLDTRKTTPGLRTLEKYAVRCGGGENHRYGLFDEVMVKENHIELAGRPLVDVLRDVRAGVGPDVRITSEARDAREAEDGVRGGADVVLLDNMTPDAMRALVPRLRELAAERGRELEIEASGGIDERTIEAVAASGVDRVSIGALTHSARAVDLSLELEPVR